MSAEKPCPVCNDVGMVRTDDIESGGWEVCPHCHPPTPPGPGLFRRAWRWFLARFRLDLALVCELSAGRDAHSDFHDYPDSVEGFPDHFAPLTCKRCGKQFYI